MREGEKRRQRMQRMREERERRNLGGRDPFL